MQQRIVLIILLVIALLSGTVSAADWEQVRKYPDQQIYIDTSDIRLAGPILTFWQKFEFEAFKNSGYTAIYSLAEIDLYLCKARMTNISMLDEDGKRTYADDKPWGNLTERSRASDVSAIAITKVLKRQQWLKTDTGAEFTGALKDGPYLWYWLRVPQKSFGPEVYVLFRANPEAGTNSAVCTVLEFITIVTEREPGTPPKEVVLGPNAPAKNNIKYILENRLYYEER